MAAFNVVIGGSPLILNKGLQIFFPVIALISNLFSHSSIIEM